MAKEKKVQETSAQRALAEVGLARMADWQKRWAPIQKQFADRVVAESAPDSWSRRRATTMAGVDTGARFGEAAGKLDQAVASGGLAGSAKQKLAVTGMGNDLATSTALSDVAADQSVDEATVAGLGTAAALGQGQAATATTGMQRTADISARQAEQDANLSLERNIGNASLAGKLVGAGAGLWMGRAPDIGMTTNNTLDQLPTAGGR